jgi:chorismate mutase
MATRGIRGATTVERNDRDAILKGTRELLEVLVRLNGLRPDDIGYVWFTVTPDLDAEFPAFAARELGWTQVPLMCGREIPVPGALTLCIRVLVSWNTVKSQREVRHAFLRGAKSLRPAWAVEV